MSKKDRVITGINKSTGLLEEVSTRCTLVEVVTYLKEEYRLNKLLPGGLYDDYHSIKVIVKP